MASIVNLDVADVERIGETLTDIEALFGELHTYSYDEIVRKMTSLDRAKYDLTMAYALNSLFWKHNPEKKKDNVSLIPQEVVEKLELQVEKPEVYLRSAGEDVVTHGIKEELDRLKEYMLRAKEIEEKQKMPRLNKEAVNRIVKHELWQPKDDSTNADEDNWEDTPEDQNTSTSTPIENKPQEPETPESTTSSSNKRGKKRKKESDNE